MREWFFSLLMSYPGAFNLIGKALFSLAGILALLGLRLDRLSGKLERIFARAGVSTPDALAAFPWWLRMAIPETILGWILLVALALLGIWFALMGKRAKKL
ncbi:hypothetical protein M0765_004180 [Variovorax sp. S2]|uniref:hypothetical protein n=1 Tax=Variovorax sp. S12S4 TaxID=3029170 RepID=UPI00215C2CDE|nr:hypothetical protein [Variovorax sp. S12S4]MCR8956962.1 hypothetical protein [Variovorax sp. S12S4]